MLGVPGVEKGARFVAGGLEFEVLEREDGMLFSIPDSYVSLLVNHMQWNYVRSLRFLDFENNPHATEGVFVSVRLEDSHASAAGHSTITISETNEGATLTIHDGNSDDYEEGNYDFPLSLDQWRFLLSLGEAQPAA